MKKFKTLLLIALIAFAGFNTVEAQTKVGHISIDQVLELMPETQAMKAELEKLGKTYEAELKAEQDKLEAKLKKYEAEAASQTDEVNQARGMEVERDRQNFYQANQIAQKDLQDKQNEKLQPIVEKARKAIEEVAAEQGIDYVLDLSTLLVAKGTDLLPAVKAKLGIQ